MKELYRIHAEMCKVFSNPIRLEILHLLRYDELSVTELIEKSRLSQANISQHLAIMKSRGVVVSRRDGKNIYYRLASPKMIKAFDIIRDAIIEKKKQKYDNNMITVIAILIVLLLLSFGWGFGHMRGMFFFGPLFMILALIL